VDKAIRKFSGNPSGEFSSDASLRATPALFLTAESTEMNRNPHCTTLTGGASKPDFQSLHN
jgi:hypothetical protein